MWVGNVAGNLFADVDGFYGTPEKLPNSIGRLSKKQEAKKARIGKIGKIN